MKVRHICNGCVRKQPKPIWDDLVKVESVSDWENEKELTISPQIQWVDATQTVLNRLRRDWSEVYKFTPEQFETLVAGLLVTGGCGVERVGPSNQKDGGIDLVFWTRGAWPILGAAQIKHHRSENVKTGPRDVRELASIRNTLPFQMGVVVTNTTFTPDAEWYAKNHEGFLRLRNGSDIRDWIKRDFMDRELWQPTPKTIPLCPGVEIEVPVFE
jgi:hypothetical protein